MAEAGYIYVIISESLKGLVKVGRSTRPPEERAKELSRPTGVPTRFHVAYQEFVADCRLAEKLVHKRLECHRVNQGREFFDVPLKEAIKFVAEVADEVGPGTEEPPSSADVMVYALVQKALALHTQGRLKEARDVASDAMQLWLDEVGGYNLYIPGEGESPDTIDAINDEVVRRFRRTFLTASLESTNPELAARIHYFPCVLPLDNKEPAARIEYLLEASLDVGHHAVNQMISDCYREMGDEVSRVDYFLRYAFAEYRGVGEDYIPCLAYVYEDNEKFKTLRDRLVEAQAVHRLVLECFRPISQHAEFQGLISIFYRFYWRELLALYKLDDELAEAQQLVCGEAISEEDVNSITSRNRTQDDATTQE